MLKIKEWLKVNRQGIQFTLIEEPLEEDLEFKTLFEKAIRLKDNIKFTRFDTIKKHYFDDNVIEIFITTFHKDLKNVSLSPLIHLGKSSLSNSLESHVCEINDLEAGMEILIKRSIEKFKEEKDAEN